jgi:hypothetical protein
VGGAETVRVLDLTDVAGEEAILDASYSSQVVVLTM